MSNEQKQQTVDPYKMINSLKRTIGNNAVLFAEREAMIEILGTENLELKEKYKDYDEIKKELEQMRNQLKKRDGKSNKNK